MQKIDKNGGGLYYQAATGRFPPFAITGKKASSLMSAAVLIIGLIVIVAAEVAVYKS
jgi:hypothetical protein